MKPKGIQNEPRNLQRHPCETGSTKYRKMNQKETKRESHFWIKIHKMHPKYHPTNHSKLCHGIAWNMMAKWCQKGRVVIEFSNIFKKCDVKQLLVLPEEYEALGELMLSNSMKIYKKTPTQKHEPKWNAKNMKNYAKWTQQGSPNPDNCGTN